MKRDTELIRRILFAVESWPPEGGGRTFPHLGYPHDDVQYNCYQQIKAGLLEGISSDLDALTCVIFWVDSQGARLPGQCPESVHMGRGDVGHPLEGSAFCLDGPGQATPGPDSPEAFEQCLTGRC